MVRPHELKLKNFKKYGHGYFNFRNSRLFVMTGPNGAGKTSIFDAIVWAIWGKTPGLSVNDVIKRGEVNCEVELWFGVDGQEYKIRRSRTATRTSFDLQFWRLPDEDLTGPTPTITQNKIEEVVGLSHDLFLNTSFIRQGDTSRFTEATPAQRKEILLELLNMSWFATAESAAKAALSATNQELLNLRSLISAFNDLNLDAVEPVNQETLRHLEAEVQLWQEHAKHEQLARKISAHLETLSRPPEDIEERYRRYLELRERYEKIKSFIPTILSLRPMVTAVSPFPPPQIEVLEARLAELDRPDVRSRIEYIQQLLNECSQKRCPLCAGYDVAAAESRLCRDLKDAQELLEGQAQIESLRAELEIARKAQRDYEYWLEQKALYEQLPVAEYEEVSAELERLADVPSKYAVAQELKRFEEQLREIRFIPGAEERLRVATERLNALLAQDAAYKQHQKMLAELKLKVEDAQARIQPLEARQAALEQLCRILSKGGAPTLLIEQVLPRVDKHANEYLAIFGLPWRIRFRTQRGGEKKLIETMDIVILDRGLEAPLGTLSGGERFLVDLAIRLAISQCVNRSNFFVLDEGWGSLDNDAQEKACHAIGQLTNYFDLIMTITHVPAVAHQLAQYGELIELCI